ncbi:MAG: hypothetical protein RID91_12540 [Azospirillaceae bacterium]
MTWTDFIPSEALARGLDGARRRRRAVIGAAARLAATGLLAGVLAACAAPPSGEFPSIGFENRPVIALDVAEVAVDRQYRPSTDPSNAEGVLPESPSDIIARWADQRLEPVAAVGRATVTIQEASLIEEALARTSGLKGVFTIDQAQRYRMRLAVRIDAANPDTGVDGYVRSVAERSTTVAENATVAEREQALFDLTDKTVRDLDAQLEANLRSNLARLVRN